MVELKNTTVKNAEICTIEARDVVKIQQSDGEVIEGHVAHVVRDVVHEDVIAIALFIDGQIVVSSLFEDEILEVNGNEIVPQVEYHGYIIRSMLHYDGARPEGEYHVGAFVAGTAVSEETPVYDHGEQLFVKAPTWTDGVGKVQLWLHEIGR